MNTFNTNLLRWNQTRDLCSPGLVQISDETMAVKELFEIFPALSGFYLQWEKDFRWDNFHPTFCYITPTLPIVSCILYVLLCTAGRRYMAQRKPFDLRWPLFAWNMLLAIFSIVGFLRTMPPICICFWKYGLRTMITTEPLNYFGRSSTGLWFYLFAFSKVPELLDTVFIVLRKKPLLFLHWYHHTSVLLYCWHTLLIHSPYGMVFAAMNFGAHSVMYLYYAMTTFKIHICQPSLVTILQISQMFVGIYICCMSWTYYLQGDDSYLSFVNLTAGSIMYSSYAILFMNYAIQRFWKPKLKANAKYSKQLPHIRLKEMAKGENNGRLNSTNGYIGVMNGTTSGSTLPSSKNSTNGNGYIEVKNGTTLPLTKGITAEISMPETGGGGGDRCGSYHISNGHIQIAQRRKQKIVNSG